MADEWSTGRLGDCVLLQSGGTPSKSRPDFWMGDVPWVSAKDMKSYWIEDTEDHLSEAGANEAARIVEERTTLLLVRGMTLHSDIPICRVRRSAAFNQDVKAVLARSGTDPEFVPYLLLGNKSNLLSIVDSAGHGTGRLNSDTLLNLPVHVPPAGEQRAIAHILGTLDDKIELNRRINEMLEVIARAIFKSWFVDFDPVRAKAEGRDPGLHRHIADLFPDRFEDSELGEIPAGWNTGTIGDGFDITMGQSPPGETYNESGAGLPFYQGRRDFGYRYPALRVYCSAPKRTGRAGDALVSVRAPVGDVNMAEDACCVGRGVAAVRHKSGSRSYTYYGMQSLKPYFEQFESEGTVFGAVNKSGFATIPFLIPPPVMVEKFESIVFPIDQQIEINEKQSRTLSELRDALLPRLISGALPVSDAKRLVDEAMP